MRLVHVPLNMFNASSNCFTDHFKAVHLLWILLLIIFHVGLCNIVLSVPCSIVIKRADLFALLCVMFACVLVTFPYCVPGKVSYLIVSFS